MIDHVERRFEIHEFLDIFYEAWIFFMFPKIKTFVLKTVNEA
jgi:hypothetical protein